MRSLRAPHGSLRTGGHVRTPQDDDARTLLGTGLLWDGQYDEARVLLEPVVGHDQKNAEALSALMNVELRSEHRRRPAPAGSPVRLDTFGSIRFPSLSWCEVLMWCSGVGRRGAAHAH